jgi:hypothetical protein
LKPFNSASHAAPEAVVTVATKKKTPHLDFVLGKAKCEEWCQFSVVLLNWRTQKELNL